MRAVRLAPVRRVCIAPSTARAVPSLHLPRCAPSRIPSSIVPRAATTSSSLAHLMLPSFSPLRVPVRQYTDSRLSRKNNQIEASEVLLIDEAGVNLGKVTLQEALKQARLKNLSLIQVSQTDPPVCRIASSEKLEKEIEDRLSSKQRAKEEFKKTGQKTKELRFGHRIEEHDVKTKVAKLRSFLKDKYKVKVAIVFKSWRDFDSAAGVMMLNNLLDRVKDLCKPSEVTAEGRFVSCYFIPDPHGAGTARVQPPAHVPVQSLVGKRMAQAGPKGTLEDEDDDEPEGYTMPEPTFEDEEEDVAATLKKPAPKK